MQDSEKRLVSKAEEYNTKKPELLGYEEMKVIVCVRVHTHTCCLSCWATRKCG